MPLPFPLHVKHKLKNLLLNYWFKSHQQHILIVRHSPLSNFIQRCQPAFHLKERARIMPTIPNGKNITINIKIKP